MKAKTIFKLIDVSFDPIQNNGYKSFVKRNGISVTNDIIYDESYPGIRRGDLYVKDSVRESKRKLPVFINIHGGGFVAGDKRHRRYFSAYVADIGYATFCINYGVGPEHKFPFCIGSVIEAMNWVAKNAETYNFDLSRIVLSGDSAGAHLASVGGIVGTNDSFAKSLGFEKPAVSPAALLLCCGPYDMTTAMESKVPLDLFNKIMKEATGYDKEHLHDFEYFEQFSPITYIDEGFPKTFLIFSKKDIFCKQHGEVLEKALREKHVDVTSFASTSMLDNHCFHLNHNFKKAKEALDKSKEFLLSVIESAQAPAAPVQEAL